MGRPITFRDLALRSVRFYWRTELSVLAGATVAGAVLVGGLLVGDCVAYSLRRLALLRLGGIHLALNAGQRFFADGLAGRLQERLGAPATAALQLRGVALRQPAAGEPVQVNRVQVMGVTRDFWRLGPAPALDLGADEVALNVKLARELGVKEGDEVALRVGKPALMPRDAPLSSRKEALSARGTLTVRRIVRDEELGRFGLAANQAAPCNAFVSLKWLQERVQMAGRANLLLVGAAGGRAPAVEDAKAALAATWDVADAGLSLREAPAAGLLQLESDRIFLDPAASAAALSAPAAGTNAAPVGVLTYMVNTISMAGGAEAARTPYSFVAACSPSVDRRLSPVSAGMGDGEMVINRWLADRLSAKAGDRLLMRYYELAPGGSFIERGREFAVRSVVEMADLAVERQLVPTFPGLTDADTCRDWDVGMPTERSLLEDPANEAYWKAFRATPKAFVTLKAGQEMWANRFGNLSAVRYQAGAADAPALRAALSRAIRPESLGLFFLPVREQALKAVAQAMNFGELFLSMSCFLIAAALMLTGLLFVFGVEQRAEETGLLRAVGCRPGQIRRLFLWEGGVIALAGSLAGAALGTQYTRALVWGLGGHWRGAVAGTSILFHVEPASIAYGVAGSFACALAAIAAAVWRQGRRAVSELMAGDALAGAGGPRRRRGIAAWLSLGAVAGAAFCAESAVRQPEQAVEAFFTAGTLLLLGGLGFVRAMLTGMDLRAGERLTIAGMGARNAGRRKGRSLTAVALLAAGCFMVLSVSSMQEDPARTERLRSSGTGGFALFGESTLPIPDDLNGAEAARRFRLRDAAELRDARIVSLKVRDGDDASCFNLNRAQAPRLLGVDPAAMEERRAFERQAAAASVWALLRERPADGAVPGLVGDGNTADWNLMKKVGPQKGDTLSYRDERGAVFRVKLVGKLPVRLSVLQGAVLIPMSDFTAKYPSDEGYRMFLVDAPWERLAAARAALSARLAQAGMDVTATTQRLREFYSVEQTYLAMFLVLGGLGLLMGTVGMGVVVLRNVLERRGELAVLRCIGFSRRQVARAVVAEHWFLLALGLLIGTAAAAVAMWPSLSAPGVRLPWGALAAILAGVLGIGIAWIALAARIALRGELLAALRNE